MTYPTRRSYSDATHWTNQSLFLPLSIHFAAYLGSKEIAHQNQETADNDSLVRIPTKLIIRRSTIKSITQPELSTQKFMIEYHDTIAYTGIIKMIRT